MPTVQCPPRNKLKDYLAGRLEEQDSAVLEFHLSECPKCEQTATSLEADPDTFVESLRSDPADEHEATAAKIAESRATAWARQLIKDSAAADKIPLRLAQVQGDVGSYELLEQLGRGGMGTVYLARHRQLDKRVAIKLLPLLSAQDGDKVARFQREMRAAGKLEHTAIVRATDAGEEHGVHFLVMEAIDGLDLSRIARLTGPLAVANACEIARQVASGLSYAHSQGVVHRDIKPSNLMLDSQGCVKILDFGLAQISLWEEATAEITTVGQLMGTLDYMAPEQAERGGAVDYRADIYSLAATLFRLLAGRPPLAASPHLSPLEKLCLLAEHQAPRLDLLREGVPQPLVTLLSEMLARDPNKRPPSAAHVAERLLPLCDGANLPAVLVSARQVAAQEPNPVSSSQRLPGISRSPARNRARGGGWLGRTLGWTAAGIVPLLLLAGLWLVIETSKGQLVIESEVGEIQVKLIEGEEEVQELQIVPGGQATRLRGGKYQIVLDAPSDSFSVSNQQFTIRNGETVVARITTRAKQPSMEPITYGEVDPLIKKPADQPLTEISYKGQSLDTWLRILKYEREPDALKDAVWAIGAMAAPAVKDKVVPAIKEFLIVGPFKDVFLHSMNTMLGALQNASGDDYLTELVDVLTQVKNSSPLLDLNFLSYSENSKSLEPILVWADSVFVNQAYSTRTRMKVAELLRSQLSPDQQSPDCQLAVLARLKSYPALTNENFWLVKPESKATPANRNSLHYATSMQQELLRRAFDELTQDNPDPNLFAQAAMVATSLYSYGGRFNEQQAHPLVDSLRTLLKVTAKDLSGEKQSLETTLVPAEFDAWAGPKLASFVWRSSDNSSARIPVNPIIAVLNLIQTYGWQQEMQESLQELHAACDPNSQVELIREGQRVRDDVPIVYWSSLAEAWVRNNSFPAIIEQAIYLQSAALLGENPLELAGRLGSTPGELTEEAVILPGTTLAIYIPHLLPMVEVTQIPSAPVVQAGTKPPVLGVPVPVSADSTIYLPLIGRIEVKELGTRGIEELIRRQYLDRGYLKEDSQNKVSVSVSILLQPGEALEVHAVTGPDPVPPQE